jgi:hypothetical protein
MEAMKLEMEQMRADKNDLRVKLAETRTKNEEIATLAKATLDPDLSNDKREKMRRRLATLLSTATHHFAKLQWLAYRLTLAHLQRKTNDQVR